MKRFLKTFVLLTASLMLLASGVNATLDQFSHSPARNSFTWYDTKGETVLSYNGEQALEQKFPRPVLLTAPMVFHRTSGDSMIFTRTYSAAYSRWF